MGVGGGEGGWQVVVSRNLNDWEISDYEKMLRALLCLAPDDSNDIPQWKLTKNGFFTVKSWYK